ncbi:MAG: hypothetical protein V3T17_06675 [Pseudomonadales bacterium]
MWGFPKANNFNALFIGQSGTGKTHGIQHMMAHALNPSVTWHITDIKGDFTYEVFRSKGLGSMVPREMIHTMDFSYVEGDAALNLLRFPLFKEAGGVFMAIQEVLGILKQYNPSFSRKMEGYISQIMEEVYEDAGISHDDLASWHKEMPTLLDLQNKVRDIIRAIQTETGASFIKRVKTSREKLSEVVTFLNNAGSIEEGDGSREHLCRHAEEIRDVMEQLLDPRQLNDEYYADWKVETLMSIKDTLQSMLSSKLFSRQFVSPKRGKINVYKISGLSPTHQQIIMRITFNRILATSIAEASKSGNYDDLMPRHILVTDEGKHANAMSSSQMGPLSRVATEGRGVGCGVWCGVQSIDHLSSDVLESFATRYVTNVSEASYSAMKKHLGVSKRDLEALLPKVNCLFSGAQTFQLIRPFA